MPIRLATEDDIERLIALRSEAIALHPFAFAASPADDRFLSQEFVHGCLRDDEQAIFVADDEGLLTGMAGIIHTTREKRRHQALVWGMYVSPHARGRGTGAQILRALITNTQRWPEVTDIHLGVSETATEARRLYEREGFTVWGREPRALIWKGEAVDELHMVKAVRR